jgi:hypothetical protein
MRRHKKPADAEIDQQFSKSFSCGGIAIHYQLNYVVGAVGVEASHCAVESFDNRRRPKSRTRRAC